LAVLTSKESITTASGVLFASFGTGAIGILTPPHFDLREIALAGQLDGACELPTRYFDTVGLDRLLPRERSDLAPKICDWRRACSESDFCRSAVLDP